MNGYNLIWESTGDIFYTENLRETFESEQLERLQEEARDLYSWILQHEIKCDEDPPRKS